MKKGVKGVEEGEAEGKAGGGEGERVMLLQIEERFQRPDGVVWRVRLFTSAPAVADI